MTGPNETPVKQTLCQCVVEVQFEYVLSSLPRCGLSIWPLTDPDRRLLRQSMFAGSKAGLLSETIVLRRRALFLVNGKARSGRADLEPIRRRLRDGGLELHEPSDWSDPAQIIREQVRDVDLIILGGGDGTIHHALPGLLETQRPFGVLPLGTANDLARTLELPLDPLEATEIIVAGHQKRIDVGYINDTPFVNVASIGLAGEVTQRLTRGAKSRWGVLAYIWAAIGALFRGRSFKVELHCDGQTLDVRTWQVAIGNGRSYGGGLTIHEEARIDDNLLHLYSLEVNQGWHILMLIPALWRGSLDPIPAVRTMQGRHIELRTINRHRPITADGELIGPTPATFRVEPQVLTVFARRP